MTGLLVVGADSAIGGRVLARARALGIAAQGTSRRGGGHLALDLAAPDAFAPPPANTAILCAGITAIAACAADFDATRRINVLGMAAVARKLRAQGTHMVFLSTNMVFDGAAALASEDQAPNPASAYGRQKAEAEALILGSGGAAVLRLTKVAWPDLPLLKSWRDDLSRGCAITPHAGRVFAPVHVDLTLSSILELARRRAEGVFHLSAKRDISYGDLAYAMAAQMGARAELVQEVPPPPPCEPGAYPAHTALAMDRLAALLGMAAPDPLAVLSEETST
jgi:dTDP-4-dehydrorhamnose reductase